MVIFQTGLLSRPNYQLLIATTLIYAFNEEITMAAGIRLALQKILVGGFKVCSLQLWSLKEFHIDIFHRFLPEMGVGTLWMWLLFTHTRAR